VPRHAEADKFELNEHFQFELSLSEPMENILNVTHRMTFRNPRLLALCRVFLIILSTQCVWQPLPCAVEAQALRFTASLTFARAPARNRIRTNTSGHASKRRVDRALVNKCPRNRPQNEAKLKIVHALDEGVGLETVSSLLPGITLWRQQTAGTFEPQEPIEATLSDCCFLTDSLISGTLSRAGRVWPD
jgi:hypothetical protein